MATSLPAPLVKGLQEIAALSPSAFDQLLAQLSAIPTEIRQHRVFSGTEFEIADSPDKGQSIKEAIFTLFLSRAGSRIPVAEFADGFIETISTPGSLTGDYDLLRARLTSILGLKNLTLVARAHDVLLEHAQTFSSSRIVSDVRPVFDNDVKKSPITNVLVHMLTIEYFNAGTRNKFVVALDDKDITALISVLERARDKSETLQRTLAQANLPYMKVI